MQRFFKHLTGLIELESEMGGRSSLPIQLGENEESIVLRVLAPGIKEEDLDIVITGQNVSITGKVPCKSGFYLQQECPCGLFQRSIELNCPVDSDKARAELKAGILTLTLPRLKTCQPRRIAVEAAR